MDYAAKKEKIFTLIKNYFKNTMPVLHHGHCLSLSPALSRGHRHSFPFGEGRDGALVPYCTNGIFTTLALSALSRTITYISVPSFAFSVVT